MKWTISIEFTPDGDKPIRRDLGTFSRPLADLMPEQIGLTLEEGRQLLQVVERAMIGNQIHAYTLYRQYCQSCGKRQHYKDVRTKCMQTVFGGYRLRSRRIRTCLCRLLCGGPTAYFPTAEIIPRRTTPEVRYLLAELGARMPYREAARVLSICGFAGMRAGRSAIRRHTIEAGHFIEGEQLNDSYAPANPPTHGARTICVGIDDTYLKNCKRTTRGQFQVTGGRFERDGKLEGRFAFVSSMPGWTPMQFAGILRQHGRVAKTEVSVVNDGDKGLRNFVGRIMDRRVESQLDWFHIGMRLEHLRKVVRMPTTYAEYRQNPEASKPQDQRVSKLRNALWVGRPWRASLLFAKLRRDVERWSLRYPGRSPDAVSRALRVIDDFQGYVCGNRRSIPNFARARAAGRRVSTAHVESVMNHLINQRMSKRQQMRWSPAGAHYLLQVRVEVLNGTFLDCFRRWHGRFRAPSSFQTCPA